MATVDRARIGKANNDKGKEAERQFAKYLTGVGWPNAKRRVVTGWKTFGRVSADCGDIAETDPLGFQIKYVTDMTDLDISRALGSARDQARAAGAVLGILIQRRAGKSNPASWWAWVTAWNLAYLVMDGAVSRLSEPPENIVPVRLLVRDLVPILHAAGYGSPFQEAS